MYMYIYKTYIYILLMILEIGETYGSENKGSIFIHLII